MRQLSRMDDTQSILPMKCIIAVHDQSIDVIDSRTAVSVNVLQKDYEALSSFEKSSTLNKDFLTPMYNKAQLYLRFGPYKKAKKILNQLYKQATKLIEYA